MLPQPEVRRQGRDSPARPCLGCHQWRVLGVGADPAAALSSRDRAILDGLGARRFAINAPTADRSDAAVAMPRPDVSRLGQASSARRHARSSGPFHRRAPRPRAELRSLELPSPQAARSDRSRAANCRKRVHKDQEEDPAMNAHLERRRSQRPSCSTTSFTSAT